MMECVRCGGMLVQCTACRKTGCRSQACPNKSTMETDRCDLCGARPVKPLGEIDAVQTMPADA